MIRYYLTVVLTSIMVILISCTRTEKRLYGFWKTTSLKLDNQSQLTITENESHPPCGNITGTTTIKAIESYLTFHKDNFYQLSIGLQGQTEIKSDSCPVDKETFKEYYSEYGSWTLLDKNIIFFQPDVGDPYQCTIVSLKKNKLSLDCSFRMWFVKPLSYDDYYTESMQLEAERISK